jgi:hypothetical protein
VTEELGRKSDTAKRQHIVTAKIRLNRRQSHDELVCVYVRTIKPNDSSHVASYTCNWHLRSSGSICNGLRRKTALAFLDSLPKSKCSHFRLQGNLFKLRRVHCRHKMLHNSHAFKTAPPFDLKRLHATDVEIRHYLYFYYS